MAGRLLHRGAAAEVEMPAGHRCGSAGRRRSLQHQHPGSRRRSADRRAPAGDAEADHHHIDIVGPFLDVAGAHGRWDIGRHVASRFT